MGDPQPDQVGDLGGVLAQVAGQREHRLGGAERVVEVPPGHLGSEPDLERRRQNLERPQLVRQRSPCRRSGCARASASRAYPAGPPSPPAGAREPP